MNFRPSNLVRLVEDGIANTGRAIGRAAVATKNRLAEASDRRHQQKLEDQAAVVANLAALVTQKTLEALEPILSAPEPPSPKVTKKRRTKK